MKLQRYSLPAALGMFAFVSLANATDLLNITSTLAVGDPTQMGRISRSGVPSDWSTPKVFPGTINPTISYHYHTYTVAPGSTNFLQIEVTDPSTAFSVSVYQDTYDPTNAATNFLGDEGSSGLYFGVNRIYFQVVVPTGHNAVVVVNEPTPNIGIGPSFSLQVEGFSDVAYTSPALTGDFSLSVAPPSQSLPVGGGTTGSYVVTVNNLNGFTGSVRCSMSALPTGITSTGINVKSPCNGASFTLTATSSVIAGSYPITITGISGALTHSAVATLVVGSTTPGFTLMPVPSTLIMLPGGTSQVSTINVQSLNGFNSAVTLTVAGCPGNTTCTISSPVTPPPNGLVTSPLTVHAAQAAVAGNYPVTVSGNAGAATAGVQVIIQDFSLTPPPTPVSVSQGGSAVSQVTLQSLNGFSQTVTVTVSGCPANTTCLFPNAQPTIALTPGPNAAVVAPLTISATGTSPVGLSNLTVTAQLGTDVHTANLPVTVLQSPDFSISANPTSISFSKSLAGTGSTTLTLTSLNAFAGNVTLSVTGCPGGCTVASPVPVSSGGSTNVTLTVQASAKSQPSSGTLTVSATSGTLVHQLPVPYTITQ